LSGQGPVDHSTNQFPFGDIRREIRLALKNSLRVLEGCGASMRGVVKSSVFRADARDFGVMNETYAEFFGAEKSARTTVQATLVEPGMKVKND
jgi:2-iminobutanoate/2-iminopropanoate deaminase